MTFDLCWPRPGRGYPSVSPQTREWKCWCIFLVWTRNKPPWDPDLALIGPLQSLWYEKRWPTATNQLWGFICVLYRIYTYIMSLGDRIIRTHYCSENVQKLILLFSKDALNWSKVTVKTFIMLQKNYISNKWIMLNKC